MSSSLLENIEGEAEDGKEEKPRRPMNAFLLYSNDMRPILQAQNPGLSTAELSKMLGDGWKSLPAESKAKYVERANQVKAEFKANHPDFVYTKRSKKTPKELFTDDGERVKRPINAFLLYNREMRPILQKENPNMSAPDISRMLGEGWRSLSNVQRQKYVVEAANIKTNFEKTYPEYVYTRSVKRGRTSEDEDFEKAPPSHEKKKRKEKDPAAPKHPMSAFLFYLSDTRVQIAKENEKMSVGKISQIAAERWSKMTPEEREPYLQRSLEDKERYAKERKSQDKTSPN